jgi:hypothetical protein
LIHGKFSGKYFLWEFCIWSLLEAFFWA